ncbi:GntR family transcriptional regulator [Microbacterium sp. MYb62]|uniref:GntR family transcriptional regulator n=1 Tax=Microbacterium sp. MYb62 TaxID=1848690 RepID=UPI000CFB5691|nr:GntR family transcriptional regulator [Microbacterium sp. MYb62]PRB18620.1 GntR family transcriptional regulator [Microbacterium sp. MYb62]
MSEDVYRRLREAIVTGELRPGERLRDYELAEDLGTSKTPVRHALDRLAEEGLVEMQRNRFTRVAPLDPDRIRDATAVFGDIWKGSVRHAMPALQGDDVTYLVDLTDDMSAAVRECDVAAFGEALRAIAVGFARIEGNSIRVSAIEILGPQIRRFTQQARASFDWDGSEKSAVDIREAIMRRDAVQARAAIVALFDDVLPGIIDRAEARERRAEPSA